MRKPIIGITTPFSEKGQILIRPTWVEAMRENGAIGCLLARPTEPAALEEMARDFDGLLFAGGDDIEPARYGETIAHPKVSCSPERDAFELALYAAFIKTGKPILGICRGCQLLNVALGGSLHQHIDGHSQPPELDHQPVHGVTIEAGTLLARLLGGRTAIRVNSYHHQAVKVPGSGAVVSAHAEDGTIEGIELPGHPFFLGVQWHPELIYHEHETANAVLAGFVEACARGMAERGE